MIPDGCGLPAAVFKIIGHDIVLNVHVNPGARRNAVLGFHGDAVKLSITTPPVDGRANEATRRFLAHELGLKPHAVTQTAGTSSRLKRFRLRGIDPRDLERWLQAKVPPGRLDND